MRGIHPFPLADAEARENWRTVNDVVDELYFRVAFYPQMGDVALGGAFVRAIARTPTVELPAAGTPVWEVVLPRLSRWQAASVRLTTWYTATVGSTNNFRYGFRIAGAGVGSVLTATTNTLNVMATIPGPAVANTLLSHVYVSAANAIPGNLALEQFQFFRNKLDAADTNANSLHLVCAVYEVFAA